MRWMALAVVAGCGRVAFDPVAIDARPDAPGPWSAPTLVAELSSTSSDDDPSLTGDMLEIYFNSSRGTSNDIWVAKRATVDEPFGTPTEVIELNMLSSESTPEVSYDGLTIFFASDRPGGLGNMDIWTSTRSSRSAAWSPPIHSAELSSSAADESPTLTPDGLALYLDSERLSDQIDKLFIATRPDAGSPWGTPTLASDLDGTAEEENPFLDASGLTMWLSVKLPTAEYDIYRATRTTRASPFAPMRRDDELSAIGSDEVDAWVSPDGHTMYLARGSVSGSLHIYRATR